MIRKTTLITLTFLGAALLVTTAQARPPRGERGPRIDRMIEHLNLDQAQEQEVRALAEQKRQATEPTRQALRQKRQELRALWEADVPNRAAILALVAEMSTLKQQIEVAKIDFRLGLHSVLTPEQRAQMREHKRERKGKHMKRHRRGGRGGEAPGQPESY